MKRFHLFFILSIVSSIFIIILTPLFIYLRPFLSFTDYLLGNHKPTSYTILLGNDTEMRANGGFIGSYAKINLNFPNIELDFQDIYVPDGQVTDHVPQPEPIQQAFGHGTWRLANADWEPDFPTSAKSLRWFFEKGNEVNPDILILVNLSTIKEIVDIVGSFPVPEFSSTITSENLYLFLQGKAEVGFFPGSTQKKDALYAVGRSFFKQVKALPLTKKIQIARLVHRDLVYKNIVVNSLNQDFQNLLHRQQFSGSLSSSTEDSYALIETNLGANKANAYIERHTNHKIERSSATSSGAVLPNSIIHSLSIKFVNSSPEANPNPPFHYGGNYIAYLRFYIPLSARDITITQNDIPYYPTLPIDTTLTLPATSSARIFPSTPIPTITSKFNFTEIGFFQITQAGAQSTVGLSYTLPLTLPDYTLTILKQNGMRTSPQSISFGSLTRNTDLKSNYFFTKKSPY